MPTIKKRVRTREDNLRTADLHRLRVLHERVVAAEEKADRLTRECEDSRDTDSALSWRDHLRAQEREMADRLQPQPRHGIRRYP